MKKWLIVSLAVNVLLFLALLYGRQYTRKMISFSTVAAASSELHLVNNMRHLLKEGQTEKAINLLDMMAENGAQTLPQLAGVAKNVWLPFTPHELQEMIEDTARGTVK
ncbi:MAG: hypothetical protein H7A43_03625 [Verrucomicrobia bacterium]|nr:hypothetical protein [Verrucomicrobiota bacterium]